MTNLTNLAKTYGISLSPSMAEKFGRYFLLLAEWNAKFNLTAITAKDDVIIKHFLDSVILTKHIPEEANLSLIDIGSGAGFPGIPVKIARPEISAALLDSRKKRTTFLTEAGRVLDMGEGFEVFHGRAEDFGHKSNHREAYSHACARAVAPLRVLCEYCLPFVKPGGYFLAMKGPAVHEELPQSEKIIPLLGAALEGLHEYSLPDNSKRVIVKIKKISQTPPKYPGKPKNIAKTPV
ncbi:MAG: 16S rRNA (guanine(527)-N(7))-methyltransferase RsmG [Oscillospiraceae bacterium]|nr:16S rRNA (guanine(527)-N(7))-methyltransferase RsmG [Oscillospiraceae bacterium]